MLDIGDRVPDVSLPDQSGEVRTLTDLAGGKRLIVFFYPKAMTPGCTGEACDFRDRAEPLLESGYEVVGVSPDSPRQNARFKDQERLPYSLLSDEDHRIAAQFGAWGLKKNYGKEYEGLIRSTFVLDESGVITHAFRNVRAKGHGERVLKALT